MKPVEKLMWSIMNGRDEEAIKIIESGLDANIQYDGASLLHHAISCDRLKITKLLIQKGANVNRMNYKDSCIPLTFAGFVDRVVRSDSVYTGLLLRNKANPNVVNSYNESPIYQAVYDGDIKFSKLLLKYKADINLGESCMRAAFENDQFENDQFDMVKLLLENGCNNVPEYTGQNQKIIDYLEKYRCCPGVSEMTQIGA